MIGFQKSILGRLVDVIVLNEAPCFYKSSYELDSNR